MALRMEICSSLLTRNRSDPFLHRIVTCDEKWILYDNRRRSAQWLNADEPTKHMPKPSLHNGDCLVVYSRSYPLFFFGTWRNEELEEMHQKLSVQRPRLVNKDGVILVHDNARPHVSRTTVQKLNELQYGTLPHPLYSPDLSPTDYHFFKHTTI